MFFGRTDAEATAGVISPVLPSTTEPPRTARTAFFGVNRELKVLGFLVMFLKVTDVVAFMQRQAVRFLMDLFDVLYIYNA